MESVGHKFPLTPWFLYIVKIEIYERFKENE